MAQYEGKLRWFNNAQGYGILSKETRPDEFMGLAATQTDRFMALNKGEVVKYDDSHGETGLQANPVKLLKAPSNSFTK